MSTAAAVAAPGCLVAFLLVGALLLILCAALLNILGGALSLILCAALPLIAGLTALLLLCPTLLTILCGTLLTRLIPTLPLISCGADRFPDIFPLDLAFSVIVALSGLEQTLQCSLDEASLEGETSVTETRAENHHR